MLNLMIERTVLNRQRALHYVFKPRQFTGAKTQHISNRTRNNGSYATPYNNIRRTKDGTQSGGE